MGAGVGYYVTHKEECDAWIAEAKEAWIALAPAAWYCAKKGVQIKTRQLCVKAQECRDSIAEWANYWTKPTISVQTIEESDEADTADLEPVHNEDEIIRANTEEFNRESEESDVPQVTVTSPSVAPVLCGSDSEL